MKLFCDAMLGRLARWLRILGYDVFYSPKVNDDELLHSDRIVITRDKELFQRRIALGKRTILVKTEDVVDQAVEVLKALGITEITRNPTRCPICNGELKPVDKEEIKELVPPKVYESRNIFWRCTSCGKIYRIGKHRLDMLEKIELIRRRLHKSR